MKRLIIALVRVEITDKTDYGIANMKTNPRTIVADYVRRYGEGVINLQIDETKED